MDKFNFFSKPKLKEMISRNGVDRRRKKKGMNFEERRKLRKGFYDLSNSVKLFGLKVGMERLKEFNARRKLREMGQNIKKNFFLGEVIHSSFFLFELDKVKFGVKKLEKMILRRQRLGFEIIKLDFYKKEKRLYKLKNNNIAKMENFRLVMNKILLQKGLRVIKEKAEIDAENKNNFDLRYKAFIKLCIFNRKRQCVKEIWKPFLNRGFEKLKSCRNLSLIEEGSEEFQDVIERCFKKKGMFFLKKFEKEKNVFFRGNGRKIFFGGVEERVDSNFKLKKKVEYLERLLKSTID